MTPRFYVPEPLPTAPLHNLFYFRYAPERLAPDVFGEPPFPNYFETAAFVPSAAASDAILLPNNFTALDGAARAYLERYAEEGKRLNKPVYAFSFADYAHELSFPPGVRVFLLSAYRSAMTNACILVPTTARTFDDVPRALRGKTEVPTVSFCGYAGFRTFRNWLSYAIRNLGWDIASLANPNFAARKVGIYWRRAAMTALTRSSLVKTRFIVRRSFSGAARTIELDPRAARKEFIDSILDADFVLAPKGDGNYSNRFLEALSLGRIPVLIDTDMPLPAEDRIPYDRFIVRVPMSAVAQAGKQVRAFYDALTEEEWKERQELARRTFLEELEQKRFFSNYFSQSL